MSDSFRFSSGFLLLRAKRLLLLSFPWEEEEEAEEEEALAPFVETCRDHKKAMILSASHFV